MRALAQDDEQVRFWVRHLRLGVVLQVLLPSIVLVHTWLAAAPESVAWRSAVCLVVIGTAFPILLVPVPALVRHPYGRLFFDGWEGVGIFCTTWFSLLDGGARSPYVMFFYVLLAHAALAYPPAGLMVAGVVNMSGFLLVGLLGDPVPAAYLIAGAATMLLAAAMCALASYNHVLAYRRIATYAGEIEDLAARDGLTGCLNHRAFHVRLAAACAAAGPDAPLALVVLDVDHFKQVNDMHGHPAGDEVLIAVGAVLQAAARSGDAAGRLGGDEFALLVPGTDAGAARAVAERVRDRIRSAPGPSGVPAITASVGVAGTAAPTAPADLLAEADRAVYASKRAGRDRVSAPGA